MKFNKAYISDFFKKKDKFKIGDEIDIQIDNTFSR